MFAADEHPAGAQMTPYDAVVGACWAAFIVSWLLLAIRFGGSFRGYYSPTAIGIRLSLAAVVLITVLARGHDSLQVIVTLGPLFAAAGAALCVAGVAFAIWARVALGSNWGMPMTRHANPELVTAGPYRWVRHPIYTGLLGMLIGTALVFPLALLPVAVIAVFMLISASREERDMEEQFGDAWRAYRKVSKRFLPFLI
jgi:protein-S-isoprenylcysteine O-methyltransferase Ste14